MPTGDKEHRGKNIEFWRRKGVRAGFLKEQTSELDSDDPPEMTVKAIPD